MDNSKLMKILYNEVREKIEDGDLIFFKKQKGDIVGFIIQLFTGGIYTHCGIAFNVEIGGVKRIGCVEAYQGTGRRFVNLSLYQDRDFDVYSPIIDWDVFKGKALESVGSVNYGWLDVMYVGLRETLVRSIGMRLPSIDFPGEICSEFIARLQGIDPSVSPRLLSELLKEQGSVLKYEVS